MRKAQPFILTIAIATAFTSAQAADIEKQLPERWERNDREQSLMGDFEQDLHRIPS